MIRGTGRAWRNDKLGFFGLAVLVSLPTVISFYARPWLSLVLGSASLIYFVAVVAPTVARRARGLSADVRGTLVQVIKRFRSLVFVGLVVSFVISMPSLICLLTIGPMASLAGLLVGVLAGGPLTLAIPAMIIEDLEGPAALRRSLYLVKGRYFRSLLPLAIVALTAVLPEAVKLSYPGATLFTIVVQPFMVVLSGVGLGSLYLTLHDR